MTYKVFRAFNLWLDDDWGFDRDDRIYAAPGHPRCSTRSSRPRSSTACSNGVRKVIVMRPGPAGGRSPADPAWDPFWARLEGGRHPRRVPRRPVARRVRRRRSPRCGSATASATARTRANLAAGVGQLTGRCSRPPCALVLGNLFGRFPSCGCLRSSWGRRGSTYCMLHARPCRRAARPAHQGVRRDGAPSCRRTSSRSTSGCRRSPRRTSPRSST